MFCLPRLVEGRESLRLYVLCFLKHFKTFFFGGGVVWFGVFLIGVADPIVSLFSFINITVEVDVR